MSVLLHAFSQDACNVPQDVCELSRLISRPLPASLARVEHSTLSSIAQEQFRNVSLHDCDIGDERQDREPLQDVLNLVLITSAAMADCARLALDGGEHRRTDMFMSLLLRTLARLCHEHSSVSTSVPFIWPKGFDADRGVATMLISIVADDSTLHLQEVQDSRLDLLSPGATQSSATDDAVEQDVHDKSKVISHAGDGDGNNGDNDEDDNDEDDGASDDTEEDQCTDDTSEDTDTSDEGTERSQSDDGTSGDSFQWYANAGGQLYNPQYLQQFRDRLAGRVPQEERLLDLPLYTQILTGQRVWPNVYFPVVCVADSSNIVALVASVAYQRRVWGIELPVVGLEVSPIGSGVRVHIGWLDPPSDDGRLPIVHTIKPAGNVSGLTAQAAAAQGVFDLSQPHSALLFSQFFLALRPQFSDLRDSISAQRLCRLEWRSDYNNATWTADIEEWAKDIDKSDDSSTTESSDEVYPLTPESSFTEHQMAPKQEKTASKDGSLVVDGKPRTRSTSTLSPAPNKPSSATAVSEASSVASSVDSRSKAWSCSAFAKLEVEGNIASADPSILTWLLYRSTFPETKYIFEPKSEPPLYNGQEKFEEMCKSYDDLTSFGWVKGWTALDKMPSVDPAVEDLRRALYAQFCEVSEEPWAKVYADEKHAKIINSRLYLLLACSRNTFMRNSGPANPLEAEARHDWDDILSYFYVGAENEVPSYNMLLERELRMPRNALVDILSADNTELCDESLNASLTWSKRNRMVFNDLAVTYEAPKPSAQKRDETSAQYGAFISQCSDALTASVRLSHEYHELLGKPDALDGVVKPQAELEPARGMCDAVLFSALPLDAAGADVRKAYKNFRLVIANPEASDGPAIPKNAGEALPRAYLHPLQTHGANRDSTRTCGTQSQQTVPDSRTSISETDILFPRLIAEYKKVADQEIKPLNQARMYLVAAVDFYAAIGIKEYPVLGLAVHGSIGDVIMAWKAENGTIHILERNIRKFDLANPIQALMFALFLLRLKDTEEELKKRFETCREKLVTDLSKGTYKNWAMPEAKKTYKRKKDSGSKKGSRKGSKSRKADVAVTAGALPRVVEEADETLAGRLGDLRLDASKAPAAVPAVDENPKKT